MENPYETLYRSDLEVIANKIYEDYFSDLEDGVLKEDYDKFIGKTIHEILTSTDEIEDNYIIDRRFIYGNASTPYNKKTIYNKEDGGKIWGVIHGDNLSYKIVKKEDHKDNPKLNKTISLKIRKKNQET